MTEHRPAKKPVCPKMADCRRSGHRRQIVTLIAAFNATSPGKRNIIVAAQRWRYRNLRSTAPLLLQATALWHHTAKLDRPILVFIIDGPIVRSEHRE
jgi:hypothetical protein